MEIIGRNNVQEWPLDEDATTRFLVANIHFFNAIDAWEINRPGHTVKLRPHVRVWAGKYLILEAEGEDQQQVEQVNALISEHYHSFFISS